jgi:hypothetical protein
MPDKVALAPIGFIGKLGLPIATVQTGQRVTQCANFLATQLTPPERRFERDTQAASLDTFCDASS